MAERAPRAGAGEIGTAYTDLSWVSTVAKLQPKVGADDHVLELPHSQLRNVEPGLRWEDFERWLTSRQWRGHATRVLQFETIALHEFEYVIWHFCKTFRATITDECGTKSWLHSTRECAWLTNNCCNTTLTNNSRGAVAVHAMHCGSNIQGRAYKLITLSWNTLGSTCTAAASCACMLTAHSRTWLLMMFCTTSPRSPRLSLQPCSPSTRPPLQPR